MGQPGSTSDSSGVGISKALMMAHVNLGTRGRGRERIVQRVLVTTINVGR
jgi:hypothetical protein